MAEAPNDNTAESGNSRSLSLSAVAAGALTLSTLVGFGYLFSVWASSGEIAPQEKLRMASSQYVAGNRIVAGNLAKQVMLDEENEDDQEWLPLQNFLSGAGTFDQAMQMELPGDRRNLLKEAMPALKTAEELGFPDGRSADGYLSLIHI